LTAVIGDRNQQQRNNRFLSKPPPLVISSWVMHKGLTKSVWLQLLGL